ncbi:MAG: hypothetical protein QM727_13795 [Niabella sp.]
MAKGFLYALLFLVVVTGCKKDFEYQDSYNKSYRAWLGFKAASGNSYTYTKSSGSWTGYASTMTITVENGQITSRSYVATRIGDTPGDVVIIGQWTEGLDEINSHTDFGKAMTLDEVYGKAKSEWLNVSKKENHIYFEAKNNGMISTCGYFPKNCADDCFTGIHIDEIKNLATK